MKERIKVFFICLLFLMLFLPLIFASSITEEEIKERLKGLEKIEDFEMQTSYPMEDEFDSKSIIAKLPNYYKDESFREGSLYDYRICYEDKWAVFHNKEMRGSYVLLVNFDGLFDFFLRIFGMGACKKQISYSLPDLTPEELFSSNMQKMYDINFEEGTFEGKDVIKATLRMISEKAPEGYYDYWEYYYDKETLLKMAQIYYCGTGSCVIPNGTIRYTNITINKGIQKSEFELFIPEGLEICEVDAKAGYALKAEIELIKDKPEHSVGELTEEDYYHLRDLELQLTKMNCAKPYAKSVCTYSQYLGEVFPECVGLTIDSECHDILLEEGKIVESSPDFFEPVLGYEDEWICYKLPSWGKF